MEPNDRKTSNKEALFKFFNIDRVVPLVAVVISSIFILPNLSFSFFEITNIWSIFVILIGLLALVLMLRAGVLVVRALVEVSVGLTLLIFLSQSYCASGHASPLGNQALSMLIIFGLVYILYIFFQALWESLKGEYVRMKQDKLQFHEIIAIILLIGFVSFFVVEIYRIISPIIQGVCIYKGGN